MGYRPDRRRLLRRAIRETYKQARKDGQSDEETSQKFAVASVIGGGIILTIGLASVGGPVCMIVVAVAAGIGIVVYALTADASAKAKTKIARQAAVERQAAATRQKSQSTVRPAPTPPGSAPSPPASQTKHPRIAAPNPSSQENDKRQAAIMFRGFQRIGLSPLRKLKNGHILYFKEPADRYRMRADGSMEFIEHGLFLLTQYEVIFQVQSDYARRLAKLTGISYSLVDVTITEGAIRDYYRMANPITAFVCLICLFKIAKVAPPVEEQKVRELLAGLMSLTGK
ncbi:hypothetical protein CCAX7_14860 [Capsulimonas corticalis]|uniref:Uncharacterized protein n=1 Tax=Capsulimonas corticalis TaxID=2219043 RepID=A0A402CZH8_9BACT|nr:hypothetical protein [Capsulimonas corticalis]BDI29435.1 hypothetical protein CCAX7_14860 [Capsulimonas corticalis]